MKSFKIISFLIISSMLIFINYSCSVKEKQDKKPSLELKASESITNWMTDNPDEYPMYKSLAFGELTPRYERTDRTLQLNDLIENEKSKEVVNQKKLDSLLNLLESNKGLLMGYTILHKYQITNVAGETIENECLFFLDSTFRIASILNPDSYDLILDPKIIFRPDSVPEKQK